ncbi:MAG: TIGR01777 family oxidoreductase [Acidobacteriia bacterium]|nr:TIGR01777 family oxidoreductase [Terriglobia bacterium]
MNLAITGASGFVGKRLGGTAVSTRGAIVLPPCDAVVNLAGEPVAQRWTAAAREKIRSSRVDGTRRLVEAMRKNPPKVLVSASAIGYYGSRGDDVLTESSAPGDDFLAKVCIEWEREAMRAEEFGVRVVILRIGVVLGPGGGALAKMLPIFRLGLGGPIADGRHWMSWIHIDDMVRLIEFALENPIRGVLNATAPNPVTNAEFTRELARVVHRPAIFPVPKFVLRMLYGEMASILWASQRVLPEAANLAGFDFRFREVGSAFSTIP